MSKKEKKTKTNKETNKTKQKYAWKWECLRKAMGDLKNSPTIVCNVHYENVMLAHNKPKSVPTSWPHPQTPQNVTCLY